MSEECPANFADIWVPDLCCLFLYIVELFMKIYVYQCKFCRIAWNVFDLFVVCLTVMGELFGSHFKDAVIIRVIRITRLARMLRLLTMFQELYLMMSGMASTLRTIFWAVIMLIAVLSVCALVAVELLKPTAEDITASGGFGDCQRCTRAFESVSASMITFFQTLIMGEGIDDVIVPMIEANWYSAFFILSVVAMVYLGISNLILSVIVEKASEARSQDAFYQNMVHKKLKADAKKVLMEFTRDADMDMSNTITLNELRTAYTGQENFRTYFKNMDMDLPFLEYAFRAQDRKGRGECSFEDFAEAVIQMRNAEVGPVVSFIRFQVAEVLDEVATLSDQIQGVGKDLSRTISQVGAKAAHTISTIPRPQEAPQGPGIAATLFGASWWSTSMGSDEEDGGYYDRVGHEHNYAKHQDMYDDNGIRMAEDDLGELLKRAYDEPLPLDLPNLNSAQQRFAELCERTESQLNRLETLCHDEPLAPARKELFVCSARLLTNLSAAMPRLLDGASAPLPPPPGYPALPPPSASRQKIRKKRQDEASEAGWDGPGSWEEDLQNREQKQRSMAEDSRRRHHGHHDDDRESHVPPLNNYSSKLADLRAKNDLSPPPSPKRKEKKRKKGKGVVEV